MGVTVKPVSSKSTEIAPDCGFVAHSATTFADLGAVPSTARVVGVFKGKVDDVSVVRPAILAPACPYQGRVRPTG
jgi:hypothetical protein